MDEIFENPVAKSEVSCGKGCSYCCHTQVSITKDEAELLASHAVKLGDIDIQSLYIQAQAQNSDNDWYLFDHEQRSCVFLDDENLCRVYEDRPSVCRTNYSFSEPSQCSTEDGKSKPMKILRTEKADMAVISAFEESTENGALPYMLWKSLSVMQETKPDQENQVLNNPLLILNK